MSRRLVLVLVVVLVLFAGVMIAGLSTARTGDTRDAPGWTQFVATAASTVMARRPVVARDISGPCVQEAAIRVAPGSPCLVRVAASDTRFRILTLALAAGLRAEVNIEPAGEVGAAVSVPLRPSMARTPGVNVLGDGASITIRCDVPAPAAPGICELLLVR